MSDKTTTDKTTQQPTSMIYPSQKIAELCAENARLRAALGEIAGETQFVSTDPSQIAREALAHG